MLFLLCFSLSACSTQVAIYHRVFITNVCDRNLQVSTLNTLNSSIKTTEFLAAPYDEVIVAS
ncbi:hypothetical protein WP1W18C01_39220 [Stenotrophomonas maltophilia]|nr:hypothetical protein WP1W18C01_39220 [Stenotrophomonas maltophilia]